VTAFLSKNVLGIKILEPGCNVIKLEPQLGDLKWVKGSYPTPKGVLYVEHKKDSNGKVVTSNKAPEGVKVLTY